MNHWELAWWARLAIGAVGSAGIAILAYKLRSLSISGAWSAMVMGTCYVILGSPMWFTVLLAFFISSSFWSKWKRHHKRKRKAEHLFAKTGRRDAYQVWANGGLGLAICAGYAFDPHCGWIYAFIGVMGAVNADTWATEIGSLSSAAPRSLLSGKKVPAGTSGGVTLLGSAAAFAGALFIGVVGALLAPDTISIVGLIIVAAIAGFLGTYVDSLLGATIQVMYRCSVCNSEVERAEHCHAPAIRIRGYSWMTNDVVNLAASVIAGLLAWVIGDVFIG